jgi:hypothetical protein
VLDSIRDGYAPAYHEDEQRDEERPEVEFLAITEGVGFVGGLFAQVQAQNEQGSVTGIHQRVNGFREHGGGSAEKESRKLRGGDREISEHRGDYSLAR